MERKGQTYPRWLRKPSIFGPASLKETTPTDLVDFSSFPGWFEITPKPQSQLPPGTQPWTIEDLDKTVRDMRDVQHEAVRSEEFARMDMEEPEPEDVWSTVQRLVTDQMTIPRCTFLGFQKCRFFSKTCTLSTAIPYKRKYNLGVYSL